MNRKPSKKKEKKKAFFQGGWMWDKKLEESIDASKVTGFSLTGDHKHRWFTALLAAFTCTGDPEQICCRVSLWWPPWFLAQDFSRQSLPRREWQFGPPEGSEAAGRAAGCRCGNRTCRSVLRTAERPCPGPPRAGGCLGWSFAGRHNPPWPPQTPGCFWLTETRKLSQSRVPPEFHRLSRQWTCGQMRGPRRQPRCRNGPWGQW